MDWEDLFFTPKESRLIELIDSLKYGEAAAGQDRAREDGVWGGIECFFIIM
jgi:hypothetical protein